MDNHEKKAKHRILLFFGIVAITMIVFWGVSNNPTRNSAAQELEKNSSPLEILERAPPSPLSPSGELAQIFSFGGKHTDLQRENKTAEIKGKIVQWKLPVYDIRKDGDLYRVQTQGSQLAFFSTDNLTVGTFINILPRNIAEVRLLEALVTGDMISFKGVISGVSMRSLEINPAILIPSENTIVSPTEGGEHQKNDPNRIVAKGDTTSGENKSLRSERLSATEKSLEDQLACRVNPQPGLAIRAMLANGLLVNSKYNVDGIPYLEPTADLIVFGKRVKYVSGWEVDDDGKVRSPFERLPIGTSPPKHIAVVLDAEIADVAYTPHTTRDHDGRIVGQFSDLRKANNPFGISGTEIVCYGS